MTGTDERAALVRFCAQYTGDPGSAEDLAQRALLAAWRHEAQLRDPQARRAWLLSIARRECLRWARDRDRQAVPLDSLDEGDHDRWLADDFDLEAEVEQADLVRLVERALALLPPNLREVLVRRYLDETPQAEVAARLGLSEGAVESRLHRGKQALRQVIVTHLSEEAAALGLMPAGTAWEETRLWCPACGRRKLHGSFERGSGRLHLRCPGCSDTQQDPSDSCFIFAELQGLKVFQTYKPATSYVLNLIHTMFRAEAAGGVTPCLNCGQPLPILQGAPPWAPHSGADFHLWHPECGLRDSETWHSLTWSLPVVRAFWKAHPRMQFLPPRPLDFAGSPAMLTGFASLDGSARVEVISLRDTAEVVHLASSETGAANG